MKKNHHEIDFTNYTATKLMLDHILFERILDYTLQEVIPLARPCYLSLSIIDEARMKELNKEYRQVDSETDVLSFPYADKQEIYANSDETLVLGDIFICDTVAKAQAQELGHTFEYEVVFLFCHGLLHLLGIHHDTDDENEYMKEKLQEIISRKGETIDPWKILN